MLMIHAKTSKAWHALNFAIVEASAGWGPSDRVKELPSLAVKHLEFLEALIQRPAKLQHYIGFLDWS